jgi:hypothetical protein
LESKNGETLITGNRFVYTPSRTCTTKTAGIMKSVIGGGGTKEDEVRECLESILCKRFARFRKSWSAAAAVAAVALGCGGRKDLKVSAFRLCKKKKKKKKKGPNSQSRNNGSRRRRRRKLRRWETTTQQ